MPENETIKFPIGRYTPVILLSILVLSLTSIPALAQQTNFVASLSGQAMSPTVSTTATGTAKFNKEPVGNMTYQIDTRNLNGVRGTHISLKNRTNLAQVFNSYMEINGKSEIPTGEVNGQLSKGVITPSDLTGPHAGKTVTDLTNLMKNDSVYVVVRTQAHENGEIQGVITPLNTGYMQGF
ncbi:MAG TPA: CHRD domain-containing protein [Nitrososphaeraceae archaeon]|nr:CHRD domain-containing protein [Nitrososphaeraceae archaeon]